MEHRAAVLHKGGFEKRSGCSSFDCGGSMYPVCGDDYVEYQSPCHLYQTSCQEGRQIAIARWGGC